MSRRLIAALYFVVAACGSAPSQAGDGRPFSVTEVATFNEPWAMVAGFLDGDGNARGRPVGVAVDRTGALIIADDAGNTVWRVTYAGARKAPATTT